MYAESWKCTCRCGMLWSWFCSLYAPLQSRCLEVYLGSEPAVVVRVLGSAPTIVFDISPAVVSHRFLEVYVAPGRLVDGGCTCKSVATTTAGNCISKHKATTKVGRTPEDKRLRRETNRRNQLPTQPLRTLPSARWPRLYVNFQNQGGHKVGTLPRTRPPVGLPHISSGL